MSDPCIGPCLRGSMPCPTPLACRLPEMPPISRADTWLMVAVYASSAITSIVAIVALLFGLGVLT